MTQPVRVVLADDHPVVLEGLKLLLQSQPDFEVVGLASDGEDAVRQARSLEPDVLVVDVSMPKLGGAEATEQVRRECPNVRVLALTVHEERAYLTRLLRAGASGYVLKRAAAEELVRAVRAVAGGGFYIDSSLSDLVVRGYLGTRPGAAPHVPEALSDREREVVVYIARGYSNKEIAAELELSVKTVETYKTRLMEKLGLRSRVELVRYATEQGWVATT